MTQSNTLEERWIKLEEQLALQFGKKPNMEAILFLVGVNEYKGRIPKIKFSKEQKQDLMHVAVCTLLSRSGYYELEGYDEEGWPHFKEIEIIKEGSLNEQETLLKIHILDYFEII